MGCRSALAAAAALLLVVGAQARPVPDARALQDVVAAIEQKDCPLAVKRLNEGIAEARGPLLLMAGAMYDEGLCLKQSWDSASRFYQRAHAVGERSALSRLVAGNALNSRDPAAALWWAVQSRLVLPPECRVAPALLPDPEGFTAVLKAWPAGRIAACVYAAGVLGAVSADAEFPGRAAALGVGGSVEMSFDPASGNIGWRQTASDVKSADAAAGGGVLLSYLQDLGERVLRRYPRPSGIDPDWHLQMRFVFFVEP